MNNGHISIILERGEKFSSSQEGEVRRILEDRVKANGCPPEASFIVRVDRETRAKGEPGMKVIEGLVNSVRVAFTLSRSFGFRAYIQPNFVSGQKMTMAQLKGFLKVPKPKQEQEEKTPPSSAQIPEETKPKTPSYSTEEWKDKAFQAIFLDVLAEASSAGTLPREFGSQKALEVFTKSPIYEGKTLPTIIVGRILVSLVELGKLKLLRKRPYGVYSLAPAVSSSEKVEVKTSSSSLSLDLGNLSALIAQREEISSKIKVLSGELSAVDREIEKFRSTYEVLSKVFK